MSFSTDVDKYCELTHPFTGLVILDHSPLVSTTSTLVPLGKELIFVPLALFLTFKLYLSVVTYLV